VTETVLETLVSSFGMGRPSQSLSREVLGGKGASLAEMAGAGFPVPPGFTITTHCCAWFDRHGRWPDGLEEQVRNSIEQLEQATGRTFGTGARPLFVAVRSGAAVSMPGMMDTILNCGLNPSVASSFASEELFWKEYSEHIRLFAASVAGLALSPAADANEEQRARRYLATYAQHTGREFPTSPLDALRQSINAVFHSWHSERALAYRKHHDIRGVTGTAVNVQAMFPSERSGVLFTADPNSPASREMVLEASWGLGEAVVSGAVTPDVYWLDSSTFKTVREIAGSRPKDEPALTLRERREIAALGRRVVAHFGVASDIEWGISDGRIALLQTRKIRGLEVIEDAERGRLEEIQRLTELAGPEPAVWVVHNLAETLPTPTPLTWDLVRWFMSAEGGYGGLYRLLGHRPREREAGRGFLELISGRIYVDPRKAAEFHFGRMPFEYDVDEVLHDRTALDRQPTRFNFERTDPLFFFRLPGLLINMLQSARRMRALSRDPIGRFLKNALPKLERFLADANQLDLTKQTTTELLSELRRRHHYVLGEFAAESLLPGFFAGLAQDQLRHFLDQFFGPNEGERLTGDLTTGLTGDITVEQNIMLHDVAIHQVELLQFLQVYGHRAVNEMELSQPRWSEDSEYIQQTLQRLRRGSNSTPRERHDSQMQVRLQAEASLAERLVAVGGSSFREQIESTMRQAQRLLPYRELGKFHLMRGYQTLRAILVVLAERWNLGRDLYFLQLDELSQFESNRQDAEARIAARKLRWRSQQKLTLPDVIDSRELNDFGIARSVPVQTDNQCLSCRSIASGVTRGIARIVLNPNAVGDLGQDSILVCPSTDPGWTPLFVSARGLIVERGGILSHGAIVARDFGIPAVALEGATRLIPDGVLIELDANRGTVVVHATETSVPSNPTLAGALS